ncbi:MAG: DUF5615 family PIN-like protein [Candidatus Omnitrophica bacterium]|nr:DUF5615 family PIN-like protein [Candidatus Omnitrophota bacterium]
MAPRVVRALRDHGYDIADIKERGLSGWTDEQVLQLAGRERRVILTHDRDFAHALFRPPAYHRGIVIMQFSNSAPQVVAERLLVALQPRLLKRLPHSVVLLMGDAATIIH